MYLNRTPIESHAQIADVGPDETESAYLESLFSDAAIGAIGATLLTDAATAPLRDVVELRDTGTSLRNLSTLPCDGTRGREAAKVWKALSPTVRYELFHRLATRDQAQQPARRAEATALHHAIGVQRRFNAGEFLVSLGKERGV